MKWYAYGHDFGNTETCGVAIVNGKRVSNTLPSVVTQGSFDDLSRLGIQLKKNDFVLQSAKSDTEQFVGELALHQSSSVYDTRGDISRYWSDTSLNMLLATSTSIIPDDEFGIVVVTGLPVQTYLGQPEIRGDIKNALEGRHVFSVNRQTKTVHVKVERTIMEGAGATIAYGVKDKRTQGVIDIGGRTTDLYTAEGQTPKRHLCAGRPLGVAAAGDLLSLNFQRKYGRPLKPGEIREVLRATVRGYDFPVLVARRKEILDLPDMASDALDHVGRQIASFVNSTWNDSEGGNEVASSFASVMNIGGGAHYFYERLHKSIPDLIFIETPEEANAYGYAVLAEQLRKKALSVA